MKVHHLNCGSMCPWASRVFPSIFPKEVACHCLLIETDAGLILVDTGLGSLDFDSTNRLGPMSHLLGISGDRNEAAINQIKKLGFSPNDVRHIIPTHLDLDHAGGIIDFPNAQIHTLAREHRAAMSRKSYKDRERYRSCHWSADTKWLIHDENYGEPWFGFNAVREIAGVPPEVLIIPLFGHTQGHFGVAVQVGSRWLLHAGDSYYDHRELTLAEQPLVGWRLFQAVVHDDHMQAMRNQRRLRELSHQNNDVDVFCAHDPTEFRRLNELAR
jgi:glyoxylase-like metal-dependent hydrolase (beta-lactamase superfamily II)